MVWLQWKLEKALTNPIYHLNKLRSYKLTFQTHGMNVISRNSDSIQFSESESYSKKVELHFHFHQSSYQGFRIYKRMRNEQTFPNTDFQSLFVESPHVVPEVLLQQRGHLILQHLFFLLPEDFLTARSDHSRHANRTEQRKIKIY